MADIIISNIQKEKIESYISKHSKRLDGRALDEYRKIEVETDVSKNAEASVSVKLGETQVLAGIKMSVTEPYPDSPDMGTFVTSAELHPMSSSLFDLGKPGIESIELGRIIDRGIRESGFIDFKKLCIVEGEKVWQIFLDIVTLNDDGNLLDAAAIAALIAISKAKLPVYNLEENKLEHKLSDQPLPLNKEAMPFNMTFHKIGSKIVVDVNKEEEAISSYRISIAMSENNGNPRITAMQKGKEGTITIQEIDDIIDLATRKLKEMYPKIKELCFK